MIGTPGRPTQTAGGPRARPGTRRQHGGARPCGTGSAIGAAAFYPGARRSDHDAIGHPGGPRHPGRRDRALRRARCAGRGRRRRGWPRSRCAGAPSGMRDHAQVAQAVRGVRAAHGLAVLRGELAEAAVRQAHAAGDAGALLPVLPRRGPPVVRGHDVVAVDRRPTRPARRGRPTGPGRPASAVPRQVQCTPSGLVAYSVVIRSASSQDSSGCTEAQRCQPCSSWCSTGSLTPTVSSPASTVRGVAVARPSGVSASSRSTRQCLVPGRGGADVEPPPALGRADQRRPLQRLGAERLLVHLGDHGEGARRRRERATTLEMPRPSPIGSRSR